MWYPQENAEQCRPCLLRLPFSAYPSPCPTSLGPRLQKLVQVVCRRNAQDKLAACIRDDCKLLLPAAVHSALEELLKLLEWCLHVDDLVPPPTALELVHRCLHWVVLAHLALLEQLLQARDANVPEQSAVLFRHDGQVCVVALKAAHERP
jgi:hypothetical protein